MTTLDIISDPICPWCYIGKTKLDRALKEAPNQPFDITWRPFQLNPDMPVEGMDRHIYLELKFGGRAGAAQAYKPIIEASEAMGLDIAFDKITRTPNTLNAHRLIFWAKVQSCQELVVTELFTRYFQAGQDISDLEVLLDIARAADMDPEITRRLLESDADLSETILEDRKAREMGIQGVPCFIVGATHVLNGAQNTDLWADIIGEISAKST